MANKEKVFLYPKIKCPYCKFYTTQAEALGTHLVDKHTENVVIGYKKVKMKKSDKTK